MQTQITPQTEALATKYATLKHQSKLIQAQLDTVAEELLKHLKPGTAVVTREFRLACNPGRSVFTFTCSNEEKKDLQNHLISKGVADYKIGSPYVQIRFLKQADDE